MSRARLPFDPAFWARSAHQAQGERRTIHAYSAGADFLWESWCEQAAPPVEKREPWPGRDRHGVYCQECLNVYVAVWRYWKNLPTTVDFPASGRV